MSKTGKKLEGNGLFESSRMMLPEHKEAYLARQQGLGRRTPPVLDEQEAERISSALARSYAEGEAVTLALFGEFADERVSGVVVRVRQDLRDALLRTAGGELARVDFGRILRVVE